MGSEETRWLPVLGNRRLRKQRWERGQELWASVCLLTPLSWGQLPEGGCAERCQPTTYIPGTWTHLRPPPAASTQQHPHPGVRHGSSETRA